MKMKRCKYCKTRFIPNKRLGNRQVTCGLEECKKQHNKHSQKKWRKKNPNYNKDRYSVTKHCSSRTPESRKQRRKTQENRAKQARYMKMYRQKKKLEAGQSVRCTKFDIAINSSAADVIQLPTITVSVGCTKFDSGKKPILTRGFNDVKENLWNVRCTKLVR
jgi:ATPase subunit of ABC transporter with duplicated ATPase domains